jgi:hypothetical protein
MRWSEKIGPLELIIHLHTFVELRKELASGLKHLVRKQRVRRTPPTSGVGFRRAIHYATRFVHLKVRLGRLAAGWSLLMSEHCAASFD